MVDWGEGEARRGLQASGRWERSTGVETDLYMYRSAIAGHLVGIGNRFGDVLGMAGKGLKLVRVTISHV